MLKLSRKETERLAGNIPDETLAFLNKKGVPEHLTFRGLVFEFDLSFSPLPKARAFRIGEVKAEENLIAIRRGTGHFGLVPLGEGERPWVFVNSSIQCFLACFASSERIWELERKDKVAWKARGKALESAIRKIDPVVFSYPDNAWAFLVEEMQAGVV
jgi:hypothetical protein